MLNCAPQPYDFGVYQPRKPGTSGYYRCVEAHFEDLETVWDDRYARKYGFWLPYVMDVIFRYLNCGDLHFGFARVKCEDCGHEYLLAFSCKRRHFCPSCAAKQMPLGCHQKRVVEFGEWLCEEVLKYVPHRQWVFSIPKRLRIYFIMDRKLLAKLSQCAWKVLNLYLTQAVAYDDAKAGAAVAVQSFGDFQNFNPHLHVLATDGCFYGNGSFKACPTPQAKDLEEPFRHEVFKMLKAEGKINDVVIENMMNWRHSGFNVYCGNAIWPRNEEGLETLARYIIRASFSQERMTYIALDWLAQLVTHIPTKGEQMVRYYGFYSNKSRGLRKKVGTDDQVPALIESEVSPKEFRKNWARLIQKIYNVDPLLCPKCSGTMRIISFIEDSEIIKKILKHLDLWDVRRKPAARTHGPPTEALIIYNVSSSPDVDDLHKRC